MSKSDVKTLNRGFKRTIVAIITAAAFVLSVLGLVEVASAHGYLAVLIFLASAAGLAFAFILLYAQGIVITESKGESK